MVHTLVAALVSAAITLMAPAILLPTMTQEPAILIVDQPQQEENIRLKIEEQIETIPMQEYLVGVVLAEMPASFHLQALKAQAVAARTFAAGKILKGKHDDCDICADSSCCQAWSDPETAAQKLGQSWQMYLDKVKQAVHETQGQVLTYEGELIEAVYFSCSGGKTEDAVAVWGSEVPYLRSVDSAGEEMAAKYTSRKIFTAQELRQRLSPHGARLDGKPEIWFGKAEYTRGGGVAQIVVGGQTFTGTQLRSILGLNSAMFNVSVSNDEIVFHVQGYGHRVGMSQYGANAMAEQGYDYKEILSHYYTDVQIERR